MIKPKLLIAADTYFPKKDGVVRFLKELVPRLVKAFQITLLVPNFEGKKIEIKKGQTTVIKLPVSKIIGITGYFSVKYNFKNKKTIKKYVQETDFVFVQDLALVGQWSIKYAKKFKKPILVYTHQINWEQLPQLLPKIIRPLAKIIIKKASIKKYNQCDFVLLPYKKLSQEFETHGLIAKKEIVRLGINPKIFFPSKDKNQSKINLDLDPKYTVIGYVGRLSAEKNLDVLLETFKKLQEKYKVYLLIVGGGSKKEMEKFKQVRNVEVTGFVANVVPYLQAMDIFVMPSLTETTSLATLEALACGVPVVTTKVGFLSEYVVKNYNGLHFPKGNAFNLYLQLKKLLRHKKLRNTMAQNARKIIDSFSWDQTAEKIKKIIKKI